jgi:methionyl-tRNA synthetase
VKVEGHGLSKSRGFVIDIEEDFIKNNIDLDAVRYYILSYTSQTKDLDFVWKDFQSKVNNELVGILGNYAYRVLLFVHKNFKQIPEGSLSPEIEKHIKETIDSIGTAVDEYRFKEAVDSTMHLAAQGNVLFQQCEPWKTIKEDKKGCQNDLFQCLQLLKAIAILIEPVLPFMAEQLWGQLGETGSVHEASVQQCLDPLTAGTGLQKPKVLFQKIDDETIEQMTTKLNKRIESAVAKAK